MTIVYSPQPSVPSILREPMLSNGAMQLSALPPAYIPHERPEASSSRPPSYSAGPLYANYKPDGKDSEPRVIEEARPLPPQIRRAQVSNCARQLDRLRKRKALNLGATLFATFFATLIVYLLGKYIAEFVYCNNHPHEAHCMKNVRD